MPRGSSDPTTGLKVGSPRSHQASNTHPHMGVPSSFLQNEMLAQNNLLLTGSPAVSWPGNGSHQGLRLRWGQPGEGQDPPHHNHSPKPYLKVVQSHDVFMFQFLGQKAKFPVSEVDSPTTLAPPASGVGSP